MKRAHESLEGLLLWAVATGGAWAVAVLLTAVIYQGLALHLTPVFSMFIGALLGGALLGVSQWLFLRPPVTSVKRWAAASALGWVVSVAITVSISGLAPNQVGRIGAGVLGGALYGYAQAMALHEIGKSRSRWVALTAVGWSVALALGNTLTNPATSHVFLESLRHVVIASMVGGLVIGVVSSVALITLVPGARERSPDTPVRWWPTLR